MKKEDLKFQVIAGQLKGRTITAPNLSVTRPPLTRVRRAIFDYLWPYLDDANYLDLFSGTGSYLFEAVSRGAANAVGEYAHVTHQNGLGHWLCKFIVQCSVRTV